jgi:hypothetical protein
MVEAQLKKGGLSLREIYEEISDQPAGMVLRSDLGAGTKLDQGMGVNLMIARACGETSQPGGTIVIPIPALNGTDLSCGNPAAVLTLTLTPEPALTFTLALTPAPTTTPAPTSTPTMTPSP